MKNRIDNKYVCWALTALSVIGISILFAFLLFRIDEIVAGIGNILKMFTPLIYGIVIAFLLKGGIRIFPRILCTVFFTCSNVYLLLELFYRLVSWFASIFDISKMKDTIITCVFLGILMLLYSVILPNNFFSVSFDFSMKLKIILSIFSSK